MPIDVIFVEPCFPVNQREFVRAMAVKLRAVMAALTSASRNRLDFSPISQLAACAALRGSRYLPDGQALGGQFTRTQQAVQVGWW